MEELISYLRAHAGIETLVLTFFASASEYLIPPLPADTIVVASALLVLAGAWPLSVVYFCVIAGGLLGALLQYGLGHLLNDGEGGFRGQTVITRLFGAQGKEQFVGAFQKHGYRVIGLNRFMPGVRAGVFLMAGALGLDLKRVMAYGLLSSMVWSALLLGLGMMIGDNFEKIQAWLSVYRYSAGGIIIALIGVFAYRKWAQRT